MKRAALMIVVAFALATTGLAAAATSSQTEVDKTVSTLNEEGSTAEGAKVVTARLTKDFGVTTAQVNDLRSKGLAFGEIAITLSLATKEPGGITDANIQKVLSLRQTTPPTGWGKVAKQLGVKLGPAVRQTDKVAKESQRDLKKAEEKGETKAQEKAEKAGKGEKAEKAEKVEKAEKAEKPDKPERVEKAERPDKPEKAERPEAHQARH